MWQNLEFMLDVADIRYYKPPLRFMLIKACLMCRQRLWDKHCSYVVIYFPTGVIYDQECSGLAVTGGIRKQTVEAISIGTNLEQK